MARRRRQWQDHLIDESTASATQDSSVLLDGDTDDTKGMTLVRTIIRLDVMAATLAGDSTDQMAVSLGIGMMSSEAIGSQEFPDPDTAGDIPLSGWLWRSRGIVLELPQQTLWRIDLDIRSQRKVMYGSPVLVIDNNLKAGTAFTVATVGIIRTLYLLE